MRLWHDDVRPAPEGWIWARRNQEAKAILMNCWPIVEISLDHDLGLHDVEIPEDPDELAEVLILKGRGEETGLDLVRWMIEEGRVPRMVTIHSWNPPGAIAMRKALQEAGYPASVAPFVPVPQDLRRSP